MSEYIGRQSAVGVAVESTRGTAETTASRWIRKSTADVIQNVDKVIDESSFGRLEESPTSRRVRAWYEGSIEGNLHADVIGYLFYQLYGAVDTTTVAGSVKDHEFTLDNTIEHPTLSIFNKDGVKQEVLNGGVVSEMSISATTDAIVSFSSTIMAKDSASNTDTVDYSETEYDFVGKDITIKIADTEGGLTSATALKVKSADINWNANAIADYAFGEDTPDNIYNSRFALDIELTKNYVDEVFENLWKSDDAKYMQIQIKGSQNIGGSNNPTITITLNKVQVQDWSKSDDNDALAEESVTLKAFYNETDEEQSKVVVRNLTASYQIGS